MTSIVVGYDGSQGSLDVMDFACAAARSRALDVEIVTCWKFERPMFFSSMGSLVPPNPDLRDAAKATLAEGVARAQAAAPDLRVSGTLVTSAAAEGLIEKSATARMLVIGSRGLGGFAGLVLGSTSIKVATYASCPVVVVRPRGPVDGYGPDEGRVVVGVDGSPDSDSALEFAFEHASWHQLGLTAVLSVDVPFANPPGPWRPVPLEAMHADREGASALLGQTIAAWQERFPDVDVRMQVAVGPAASALAKASAGADLLVVGSRGLGGFRSMLLGSVSHAVLHHAYGPVAVVRTGAL